VVNASFVFPDPRPLTTDPYLSGIGGQDCEFSLVVASFVFPDPRPLTTDPCLSGIGVRIANSAWWLPVLCSLPPGP